MGGGSSVDSGGNGGESMTGRLLGHNSDITKPIDGERDEGECSKADGHMCCCIAAESLCVRLCLSSSQVHRDAERKGLDISKKWITFFALPSSMTPPQNGRDVVQVGDQSQEKWTVVCKARLRTKPLHRVPLALS